MNGQQQQGNRTVRISKKRKFVADGVFFAELHEFFQTSLKSAGYAGIEVKVTPAQTKIVVSVTKAREARGEDGRRTNELTSLLQKRFGYKKDAIEIIFKPILKKGLCASAQVENLKYKLLEKVPVRLAAQSIIRGVMKDGALGCEVLVSGKLRQQRAKTMKFKDGFMICTGQPKEDFIDVSVRHVFFKQGIMGVKVKIMLPEDTSPDQQFGGVSHPLPDTVVIAEPKEFNEREIRTSHNDVNGGGNDGGDGGEGEGFEGGDNTGNNNATGEGAGPQ